jgi:hypothetical protein
MEQAMTRLFAIALLAGAGCAGASPSPPPTCDQICADGVALRAVRSAMKAGFNRTLQGKDAGMQDEMSSCLGAGSGHIHGNVETNATVGTMDVDLTYEFEGCRIVLPADPTPAKNLFMAITGTITEKGIISAQPTSTTSLIFGSSAMSFSGTVYSPPVAYEQTDCALDFTQDGNLVAGTVCGRPAGFSF